MSKIIKPNGSENVVDGDLFSAISQQGGALVGFEPMYPPKGADRTKFTVIENLAFGRRATVDSDLDEDGKKQKSEGTEESDIATPFEEGQSAKSNIKVFTEKDSDDTEISQANKSLGNIESNEPLNQSHSNQKNDTSAPGHEIEKTAPELDAVAMKAAMDDAYAKGVDDGRRQASEELDEVSTNLAKLISDLRLKTAIDTEYLGEALTETIIHLVKAVTDYTVSTNYEYIASHVESAINVLSDHSEVAEIIVHPSDLELLKERDHKVFDIPGLSVSSDTSLIQGSVRARSKHLDIDDDVGTRLDSLREKLGHALPSSFVEGSRLDRPDD